MTLEEFLARFTTSLADGSVWIVALFAGVTSSSLCPCTLPVGLGMAGAVGAAGLARRCLRRRRHAVRGARVVAAHDRGSQWGGPPLRGHLLHTGLRSSALKEKSMAREGLQTIQMKVSGMMCSFCTMTIEKA